MKLYVVITDNAGEYEDYQTKIDSIWISESKAVNRYLEISKTLFRTIWYQLEYPISPNIQVVDLDNVVTTKNEKYLHLEKYDSEINHEKMNTYDFDNNRKSIDVNINCCDDDIKIKGNMEKDIYIIRLMCPKCNMINIATF